VKSCAHLRTKTAHSGSGATRDGELQRRAPKGNALRPKKMAGDLSQKKRKEDHNKGLVASVLLWGDGKRRCISRVIDG